MTTLEETEYGKPGSRERIRNILRMLIDWRNVMRPAILYAIGILMLLGAAFLIGWPDFWRNNLELITRVGAAAGIVFVASVWFDWAKT